MSAIIDRFAETIRTQTAYGSVRWLARPNSEQTTSGLVVVEVIFTAGSGHPFHFHPEQDEVIYVLEGTVQQWVDQTPHVLQAGDAVFVPRGTVHGSMNAVNATESDARVLVIRAKPQAPTQPDAVEVHNEAPWHGLWNGLSL
jgi:quercetin dioxygenase-like cupin family protein